MSDYKWRDKVDPASFPGSDPEKGFRHYRAEYIRLMNILTGPNRPTDRDELQAMRSDANHAAARCIGWSQSLIL